jgi:RND family efflux transporter MFP subunit
MTECGKTQPPPFDGAQVFTESDERRKSMTTRFFSFRIYTVVLVGILCAATLGAEDFDCLIEPQQTVSISSPIDGVLDKVYVDRGSIVKRGQVLAQLESSLEGASVTLARARADMDAAIKSSEARLEFSTTKFIRSQKLYEKNFISAADLQDAETEKRLAEMALLNAIDNKRVAELELERANAALARQTIRSPINGVVVERFLSPGEYSSGQLKRESPIMKLAQIDPLRVEVYVPASLYGKISVGSIGKVSVEAPTTSTYDARISIIDRVIDSASATFRVRLELPNPSNRIPAGLRCKIAFGTAAKPGAKAVSSAAR